MSERHAAVVLAAGGSRRLGHPKQLLQRDGEPLVHRAARLALATGAHPVLLVVGAAHERVAAACVDLALTHVHNRAWSDGLAGSLRRAAAALGAHAGPVLVLGCDQPALSIDHLRALLSGAGASPSRCAATAYGDRVGSPAVVPASMLHALAPDAGDRGLGVALGALPRAHLHVQHEPALALDIDTGDDAAAARALGWLDAG